MTATKTQIATKTIGDQCNLYVPALQSTSEMKCYLSSNKTPSNKLPKLACRCISVTRHTGTGTGTAIQHPRRGPTNPGFHADLTTIFIRYSNLPVSGVDNFSFSITQTEKSHLRTYHPKVLIRVNSNSMPPNRPLAHFPANIIVSHATYQPLCFSCIN